MRWISARLTLITPAAPTPCTARKKASHSSRVAQALASAAALNSVTPSKNTLRAPQRSPNEASGNSTATTASW